MADDGRRGLTCARAGAGRNARWRLSFAPESQLSHQGGRLARSGAAGVSAHPASQLRCATGNQQIG